MSRRAVHVLAACGLLIAWLYSAPASVAGPAPAVAILGPLASTDAHDSSAATTTASANLRISAAGGERGIASGLRSSTSSISLSLATKAGTGGADAVRLGQAGEAAVRSAYEIGPKATRVINGRTRIFDG